MSEPVFTFTWTLPTWLCRVIYIILGVPAAVTVVRWAWDFWSGLFW